MTASRKVEGASFCISLPSSSFGDAAAEVAAGSTAVVAGMVDLCCYEECSSAALCESRQKRGERGHGGRWKVSCIFLVILGG